MVLASKNVESMFSSMLGHWVHKLRSEPTPVDSLGYFHFVASSAQSGVTSQVRDVCLEWSGHNAFSAGVTVPADSDDDLPWKIRRGTGQRRELDEEEDVGTSDGDEDVAAERFSVLTKADDEQRRAVTQGIVASVMSSFKLTKEESEAQCKAAADSKKKKKQQKKRVKKVCYAW
jgi:hypothetical protein